ncbi:hypothetical protein CRG98_049566, partial [Punica granatum]
MTCDGANRDTKPAIISLNFSCSWFCSSIRRNSSLSSLQYLEGLNLAAIDDIPLANLRSKNGYESYDLRVVTMVLHFM